jgi:hypothetical protein
MSKYRRVHRAREGGRDVLISAGAAGKDCRRRHIPAGRTSHCSLRRLHRSASCQRSGSPRRRHRIRRRYRRPPRARAGFPRTGAASGASSCDSVSAVRRSSSVMVRRFTTRRSRGCASTYAAATKLWHLRIPQHSRTDVGHGRDSTFPVAEHLAGH